MVFVMIGEDEIVWEDEGCLPPSRRESALASLDCWDYTIELECLKGPEDLHLAAELGKNLLERNKELENDLKQKLLTIDELTKENEHLTKQTAALRSTNDNRIRLSEQLEVSIQELESANKRLTLENSAQKKEVKSLSAYKLTLEARCEDLDGALEKTKEQLKQLKTQIKTTISEADEGKNNNRVDECSEDLSALNEQLKKQLAQYQRTTANLELHLTRLTQDYALLEEDLQRKEIQCSTIKEQLDSVEHKHRVPHMCQNCHEFCDGSAFKSEDAESYGGMHVRLIKGEVDEYDQPQMHRRLLPTVDTANTLSLQDELKMTGDFTSITQHAKDATTRGKVTPTDFSETETSSSGFADETSCKATQTDDMIPGSFLCAIQDGEDCMFSIYDTLCPIENRFRKTPVYRTLFREIFEVLKRAAESKNDEDQLPLLDDTKEPPKVPPVTPAAENMPIDFEDLISLPDSVAYSDASSIPETLPEEAVKEEEGQTSATPKGSSDILEYVSHARIKLKKRSSNTPNRRRRREVVDVADIIASAEPSPSGSPARGQRRRSRRAHQSPADSHLMTTVQRQQSKELKDGNVWEYQPFHSTASQEVAKLKKLEKTYAEVLAYTPKRSFNPQKNGRR